MGQWYDTDGENVWPVSALETPLDRGHWVVAKTKVADWEVSTVFLGLDHSFGGPPPVLWETMVFGIPGGRDVQVRYTSAADARDGHAGIVARLTAGREAILAAEAERQRAEDLLTGLLAEVEVSP